VRHVAVIDIGKTNAKLVLVDMDRLAEVAVKTRPNTVVSAGPYPHYDIDGLWNFILDGLAALNREHPIDAISVTTHGATAALLDAKGDLVLPVLDYEHTGPDEIAQAYDAVRPPFEETGTPRLPVGLNLAAQIFWQANAFPADFGRAASIVMYPQYWTYRLSGVLANEVTSLGCHTDLWNPSARDFSSLVNMQGWRRLMAPARLASDRLGAIEPAIAMQTGIAIGTPVFCGIHDSNASLLPHLLSRKPPFAVVSTGTWVISMAIGAKPKPLDPARDTLINVNAFGDPVPSARFMGGREFATLTGSTEAAWDDEDIAAVLDAQILLLPSVQQGSGPYPDREMRWSAVEPSGSRRTVAASFYLAMMTATCLDLIGAEGPMIVEGPFARNTLFTRMLAATTGRPVIADADAATGTSIGAALLAVGDAPPLAGQGAAMENPGSAWSRYAAVWRAAVESS